MKHLFCKQKDVRYILRRYIKQNEQLIIPILDIYNEQNSLIITYIKKKGVIYTTHTTYKSDNILSMTKSYINIGLNKYELNLITMLNLTMFIQIIKI